MIAGQDGKAGAADGAPGVALLNHPTSLCVNPQGAVVFADGANACLRQVNLAGEPWAESTKCCCGAGRRMLRKLFQSAVNTQHRHRSGSCACARAFCPHSKPTPRGPCAQAKQRPLPPGMLPATQPHPGMVTTLAGQCGHPGDQDGSGQEALFSPVIKSLVCLANCSLLVGDAGTGTLR